MRLSYSVHREEYVAGVEAIMSSVCATDEHLAWNRNINRVIVAYYVSIAVAVAGLAYLYTDAAGPLFLLAAVLLLLDGLMRWGVSRVKTLGHGVTFDARNHEHVEAVFDDEAVAYGGPEYRQEWKWTAVQRFHDLAKVYVMEFVGFEMIVVPKRVFSSPVEAESWLRQVNRHVSS